MNTTSRIYLILIVAAVVLIVFGAVVQAIKFLLWVGVVLAVLFAIAWLIHAIRRRSRS